MRSIKHIRIETAEQIKLVQGYVHRRLWRAQAYILLKFQLLIHYLSGVEVDNDLAYCNFQFDQCETEFVSSIANPLGLE